MEMLKQSVLKLKDPEDRFETSGLFTVIDQNAGILTVKKGYMSVSIDFEKNEPLTGLIMEINEMLETVIKQNNE